MIMVSILISFISYSIYLQTHYSVDAYNYYYRYPIVYKGQIKNGRIGQFLLLFLFQKLNIVRYQQVFTVLLITFLGIAIAVTYYQICGSWNMSGVGSALLYLGIALCFSNVLYNDLFVYIEAVYGWIGGGICVLLALSCIKPNIHLKGALMIMAFVFAATSFYQAMVGIFVGLASCKLYYKSRGKITRYSVRRYFVVLFCTGVGCLLNIFQMKLIQNLSGSRIDDRTVIVSISEIFHHFLLCVRELISYRITAHHMLPIYSNLVIWVILMGCAFYTLINRKSYNELLYVLTLYMLFIVVLCLPNAVSSGVWLSPRSIIGYGVWILFPLSVIELHYSKKAVMWLALVTCGIYLLMNLTGEQKIGSSVIASNKCDEELSWQIQNRILQYQQESGNTVTKIQYHNDPNPCWGYRSIHYQEFEQAERSLLVEWSAVRTINFYTGSDYDYSVLDDSEYDRIFGSQDWDCFDADQQIKFFDNTCYIAMY